jgi:hypothetical protein
MIGVCYHPPPQRIWGLLPCPAGPAPLLATVCDRARLSGKSVHVRVRAINVQARARADGRCTCTTDDYAPCSDVRSGATRHPDYCPARQTNCANSRDAIGRGIGNHFSIHRLPVELVFAFGCCCAHHLHSQPASAPGRQARHGGPDQNPAVTDSDSLKVSQSQSQSHVCGPLRAGARE